jgi:hypothetical protein
MLLTPTPLRAAVAAAALVFSAAATDARTVRTKRDAAWVPSDPQAFQIDLGFDRVGRYVTPMGMVSRESALVRSLARPCS